MKKVILMLALLLAICAAFITPVSASDVSAITSLRQTVYPGSSVAYVMKSDDSLWGWGTNYYGRLGNGKGFEAYYDFAKTKWIRPYVDVPYKILDNVSYFDSSDTWAIKKDKSLWVWGETAVDLGIASDVNKTVPVKFMDNVVSFSISKNPNDELIAYAVLSDGSLLGWGGNSYGELGNGSSQKVERPTLLMEDVRFVQYAYARFKDQGTDSNPYIPKPGCTFIIKTDNSLWTWGFAGSNHHGLSGTGDNADMIGSPVMVLENVSSICNYEGSVAAITKKGDLYVWGEIPYHVEGSQTYTIGLSSSEGTEKNVFYYITTPYLLAQDVKDVSFEIHKVAYLKKDGTAYCWGQNGTQYFKEPYPVMDGVASLSIDDAFMMLLKQNGELWAYGYNVGNDSLGIVTEDNSVDPPQKVLTDIAEVITNGTNSFAVKNDGSLWGVGGDVEHTLMGKGWQKAFIKLMDGVKLPYQAPAVVITPSKRTGAAAIFRDVPQGAWYDKFLLNAYNNGVIGGMREGIYGPDYHLTHAQIMVMAANLHSLEKRDHYDFAASKKSGDAWYQVFEDYCKAEGIIDNQFDGLEEETVNRGQMAYYFAHTLEADSYKPGNMIPFLDTDDSVYYSEIYRLANADIVGGYPDGTFRPDALVTRAEASVFISNILDAIGE